jgi:NitT/TauT family transport system substrate-binding protein
MLRLTRTGRFVVLAGALVIVVLGVWALTSWRPQPQGPLGRPLRVGIVSWPGYAGGIVANDGLKPSYASLFWKNHNLLVEFILDDDTDAQLKRFKAGGLDIVWSTVDSWAAELPTLHIKARAILQVDWSRGGDAIVVADPTITKIEDLSKVANIALAKYTPSHWLLEKCLLKSGLSQEQRQSVEKHIIPLNKEDPTLAREAFESGSAQVAVVWQPEVMLALRNRHGSHILVDTSLTNKWIADVMVAREDFIVEHPKVISAFIKGWIDGTAEANRDNVYAANLLVKNEPQYRDLGFAETKRELEQVKWAGLPENTEMFGLDDHTRPLFDDLFKEATQVWLALGYIGVPVPVAEAKEDRFVRALWQESPVEAPKEEAVVCSASAVGVMTEPVEIVFPHGRAELGPAAEQLAEHIAVQARETTNACIWIQGNTDNVGDPKANKILSERRAKAVVDYLLLHYSFNKSRIIAQGNGDTKPRSSNDTAEGRRHNRRVDVQVSKTGQTPKTGG